MGSCTWSGHYSLDPSELETRFAVEDGMAFMDSIFEESTEESIAKIQRVNEILESLPPREADFVDLYYFKHLKQTDIAEIFKVSQPTVCYRLSRAASRIRFLFNLPDVDLRQMEKDLEGFLSDPLDIKILILMWQTTCQSEVADHLEVSQGLVRHRYLRSLKRMRASSILEKYVKIFEYLEGNLNIIREVQRPNFEDRITHTIR
jgi:DNA-directed RNA polymerase specialized sigma24 family protein